MQRQRTRPVDGRAVGPNIWHWCGRCPASRFRRATDWRCHIRIAAAPRRQLREYANPAPPSLPPPLCQFPNRKNCPLIGVSSAILHVDCQRQRLLFAASPYSPSFFFGSSLLLIGRDLESGLRHKFKANLQTAQLFAQLEPLEKWRLCKCRTERDTLQWKRAKAYEF